MNYTGVTDISSRENKIVEGKNYLSEINNAIKPVLLDIPGAISSQMPATRIDKSILPHQKTKGTVTFHSGCPALAVPCNNNMERMKFSISFVRSITIRGKYFSPKTTENIFDVVNNFILLMRDGTV